MPPRQRLIHVAMLLSLLVAFVAQQRRCCELPDDPVPADSPGAPGR